MQAIAQNVTAQALAIVNANKQNAFNALINAVQQNTQNESFLCDIAHYANTHFGPAIECIVSAHFYITNATKNGHDIFYSEGQTCCDPLASAHSFTMLFDLQTMLNTYFSNMQYTQQLNEIIDNFESAAHTNSSFEHIDAQLNAIQAQALAALQNAFNAAF